MFTFKHWFTEWGLGVQKLSSKSEISDLKEKLQSSEAEVTNLQNNLQQSDSELETQVSFLSNLR